jgi:hypothetical protein
MTLSLPPALRRVVIVGLALGSLALALTASSAGAAVGKSKPTARAAATGSCDRGDFCMWENSYYGGGLYEWSGNDGNLGNDHFENVHTNLIVNNRASSAYNYGYTGAYDDVIVYDGFNYSGAHACVANLTAYPTFYTSWNDHISSYKWVNAC